MESNQFFNEGLNILFNSVQSNNTELLAEFIAHQLKNLKKNSNFFLKFLKTTLHILNNNTFNSNFHGIKIKIKGRLKKSPRAKHQIITIGNIPLLMTIDSNIEYSEKIAYTSNGTIGVKVWVYKK